MRWFGRHYRRWFGTISIDAPAPVAAEAPYTFFRPSENELLALAPGDLVKIIVRSHPPSPDWDCERMWFTVKSADGENLTGALENIPYDMPQLRVGTRISFKRSDVVALIWSDERSTPPPPPLEYREYWDRCLVDACLLNSAAKVHYIYRGAPEPTQDDDTYPDSGWRIRGDYRDTPDDEVNARETEYVALGLVLNHDDSWLRLIDAPVGSGFLRNWETGVFEREER